MHLHCHLKDVLLDYGPSREVWLFPFERYNGTLGNFPTNSKNFEPQIMSRFLRDLSSSSYQFPDDLSEHFKDVCESLTEIKNQGSLLDTEIYDTSFKMELPKKYVYASFDSDDTRCLESFCSKFLENDTNANITVNSLHLKYYSILINDKQYNSTDKSSFDVVALAKYDTFIYGASSCALIERPVKIHYFAKISFTTNLDFNVRHLIIAIVSWFSQHPDYSIVGKPVGVWCNSLLVF
jgi:hypothetical protein